MKYFLVTGLALLAAACQKIPPETQFEDMKVRLLQRFNTQNQEAEITRVNFLNWIARQKEAQEAMASGIPATGNSGGQTVGYADPEEPPAEGRQYDMYAFRVNGVIVDDVRCAICKTTQTVTDFDPERDSVCAFCGGMEPGKPKPVMIPAIVPKSAADGKTDPAEIVEALKKHGFSTRRMFEPLPPPAESDNVQAIVRYVRELWVYDPVARVGVPSRSIPKLMEKAVITDASALETPYGYHRPNAAFVAEQKFEYRRGKLVPLGQTVELGLNHWRVSGPPK